MIKLFAFWFWSSFNSSNWTKIEVTRSLKKLGQNRNDIYASRDYLLHFLHCIKKYTTVSFHSRQIRRVREKSVTAIVSVWPHKSLWSLSHDWKRYEDYNKYNVIQLKRFLKTVFTYTGCTQCATPKFATLSEYYYKISAQRTTLLRYNFVVIFIISWHVRDR